LGATILLTLAGLIKAPLLLLLVPTIAVSILRRPPGRRMPVFLWHAGIVVSIGALLTAPFIQGHDPTLGVARFSYYSSFVAPSSFLQKLLTAFGLDGLGTLSTWLHRAVRLALPALFVVAFVFIVRRAVAASRSAGTVEMGAAWGWTMLLVTLSGPLLFPWHIMWTLPLVWLLPRTPRLVAIAACAILPLSESVVGGKAAFLGMDRVLVAVGGFVIAPIMLVLLARALGDLRDRSTNGEPIWEASPLLLHAEPGMRAPHPAVGAR
jgi:hypothetical protein